MNIFKKSFIFTLSLASLVSAVVPITAQRVEASVIDSLLEPKQAKAQTTVAAPTVYVQYGDDGGLSPNLPGNCGNNVGTAGTVTYDRQDPDCLRVQVLDTPGTLFNQDFRFCLSYNLVKICTGWASEIGVIESSTSMTSGQRGGDLSGDMYAIVETRALNSTELSPNTTFSDVTVGVALAYQKDYNACQGSSGLAYGTQGQGWSNWAYGANQDNDPGCFRASMRVGTVNSEYDAEYVSTTLPSTASANTAYNNNKNIVMRNTGSPWQIMNQASSVVRDVDGHCSESNFSYNADGSNSCTDYKIYTSQRFRLERLDSTPVAVRSKQLATNSNSVGYSNGNYSFSGADTSITAQSDRNSLSTANTIPFYAKQEITYRRYTGSYEECFPVGNPNPGDPSGPGDQLPVLQLNYLYGDKDQQFSILDIFNIKEAKAYVDGNGEECTTYDYDYVGQQVDDWQLDVVAGEEATFAPINYTTPGNGSYTLRFRMVDLDNVNSNSNGRQLGQFGDEAQIVMQVGTPWTLGCSIGQSKNVGEPANYLVWATGTVPTTITVTLTSVPSGPSITVPLTLNTANSYTATANIDTSALAAGTYTLSFIGSDGTNPTSTCNSSLTINNSLPTVDLDFNGSDGPVILTGNTTTGTLTWSTADATSCTASTSPSAVTPDWTGSVTPSGGSQSVSGLAYGTAYTFTLNCTGPGGSFQDTVQVSSTASNPTGDLQCVTGGTTGQQTCNTTWGGSGALHWTSTFATSCSISDDNASLPDIGSVPTSVSSGSPYNTGNLYTTTTFTLTCQGVSGTTPSSDTLTITVSSSPDYTFSISPLSSTVQQGVSTPVSLLSLNPVEGFNSLVTMSVKSISPSVNAPTVSAPSNSPHVPAGVSNVTIDTSSASPGSYTIEFAANGGGIAEKTRTYVLTVVPSTPPDPVVNLTANNATCGVITSTWQAANTHTTGMEYRVYKNTDGSNNWTYLTTIPYVSGQSSYSYTDGSPSAGSNYYSVLVYNGSTPSTRQITSPVAPQTCSVNLDFSNKDLIRVNNNTTSAGSDVESRCNGQSDVFTLPNQGIFKDGDKVYFRINVCNNGTQALTGISVNESASLSGLTNIAYESSYTSPSGCVTNANDTTKIYTLGDLGPAVNGNATICSFVLSATVSSGGGPAGELFRFQNVATITAAEASKTIATPKYLFGVGSGVPDRNETSP